jgi:hypothetical protein
MIWLTVITTLLRLVPMVLEMVRDGRIKEATTTEVLDAFEVEFRKRWQARVDAAVAAGNDASSGNAGGLSNAQANTGTAKVTPEGNDPFDRAGNRKVGGK